MLLRSVRLGIVLLVVAAPRVSFASPYELLKGQEHALATLILSKDDDEVSLAARAPAAGSNALLSDLLAERFSTGCLGNGSLGDDALAVVARTLGQSGQERYRNMLQQCLSRTDASGLKQAIRSALKNAMRIPGESYPAGSVDLAEVRKELAQTIRRDRESQSEVFRTLEVGQSLSQVYEKLGPADVLSAHEKADAAHGHYEFGMGALAQREFLIADYMGLGSVLFGPFSGDPVWKVSNALNDFAFVMSTKGHFVARQELIQSGDDEDLARAAQDLIRTFHMKPASVEEFDLAARRLYTSRSAEDPKAIDALSWVCKALKASANARYRPFLVQVADTAASPKLRKYAAASANDLEGAVTEAFDPTAVQPKASSTSAKPGKGDTASRLRELADLKKQGLITSAEYEKKRKEVIDGL